MAVILNLGIIVCQKLLRPFPDAIGSRNNTTPRSDMRITWGFRFNGNPGGRSRHDSSLAQLEAAQILNNMESTARVAIA